MDSVCASFGACMVPFGGLRTSTCAGSAFPPLSPPALPTSNARTKATARAAQAAATRAPVVTQRTKSCRVQRTGLPDFTQSSFVFLKSLGSIQ